MKNKEAIEILSKDLGKYILTEHDEAILTAINALEERPQGDLISRSALKETIELEEGIFWDSYSPNELVVRKKYIDDAPTVIPDNDIFEWCTDCKEYDQEKHCCHRWSSKIREAVEEVKQYKLDELRPQGEWICKDKVDGHMFGYSCSNCRNPEWQITRFCPNCGADMRKGGAE